MVETLDEALRRAEEQADRTRRRVLELTSAVNAIRQEQTDAEADNRLAQAHLTELQHRVRRGALLPIGEGYKPKIYGAKAS
jgi:hypothetical protein